MLMITVWGLFNDGIILLTNNKKKVGILILKKAFDQLIQKFAALAGGGAI